MGTTHAVIFIRFTPYLGPRCKPLGLPVFVLANKITIKMHENGKFFRKLLMSVISYKIEKFN